MPRQPRLDAPGILQHVMGRGLDRQTIFRDDRDRADFVNRLAGLVEAGGLRVYAWALLPNHFHLLVSTGSRPLARNMRILLTGYAGEFNRRHRRRGHLFQNRYKSIVVEEEPYLLELVRYIHLNPLRARAVPDLNALDRFPWSGHAALMGSIIHPWQETAEVLMRFGRSAAPARRAYRAFLAVGVSQGKRPELQGGGLIRSAGGWQAVQSLRRGRESFCADERVLGGGEFVESLRREAEERDDVHHRLRSQAPDLPLLAQRVAKTAGITQAALFGAGRARAVVRARDGLAYIWVELLGRSGEELARVLRIHAVSVYRAARRGCAQGRQWEGCAEM